jgi:hypothetical protein
MGASFPRELAMTAMPPAFAAELDDHAEISAVDAAQEDAYWREAFRYERYYSAGLDYEDYAPAYCVGYIGYAQYGGGYDDAEGSLCANWERIKCDSRLALPTARDAMRAAWDRAAQHAQASQGNRQPARFPAGPARHAAPG